MARSDDPPVPDRREGEATPPVSLEAGRFAYDRLERAIHEKARLGIMTSLMSHPGGLAFNDLKGLCNLTDGNLSRHLQVLQEEGLVELARSEHRRRPQTLVRLSERGRARFLSYLAELEQVIADAMPSRPAREGGLAGGWSPA